MKVKNETASSHFKNNLLAGYSEVIVIAASQNRKRNS